MVPKFHFKWCWADSALSIWPSQVFNFKEIKNFWDVPTGIRPVSASCSECKLMGVPWFAHSHVPSSAHGTEGNSQTTHWLNTWKKMNWACQRLLSKPHALYLFSFLVLIICQTKGSCHSLIKRDICRVKMMTFCNVISSPETIMLIKVLFSDHLQKLSMNLKESQHHGGS